MWKLLSMDVRNKDSFLPKKGKRKDAHDMVFTLWGIEGGVLQANPFIASFYYSDG